MAGVVGPAGTCTIGGAAGVRGLTLVVAREGGNQFYGIGKAEGNYHRIKGLHAQIPSGLIAVQPKGLQGAGICCQLVIWTTWGWRAPFQQEAAPYQFPRDHMSSGVLWGGGFHRDTSLAAIFS